MEILEELLQIRCFDGGVFAVDYDVNLHKIGYIFVKEMRTYFF